MSFQLKLILLGFMLLSGCVSQTNGFKLDPHLEDMYMRVVTLENQCKVTTLHKVIQQMEGLVRGENFEGEPPYWLIPQRDLIARLEQLHLSEPEARQVRLHLIKKHGLISSLVRISKGKAVEMYIAPTDQFALTQKELSASGYTIMGNGTLLLQWLHQETMQPQGSTHQ